MRRKRYYNHLRLNYDFFDKDIVKYIESMDKGKYYLYMYIRLLCMADYYEIGYRFIEKLYTETLTEFIHIMTSEKEVDIDESLEILESLDLVEREGNLLIIKDINIDLDKNRTTKEYKEWRTSVFERDDYTCQGCGMRGGGLNAHHIKEWAYYPKDRFDINNGITLCVGCHREIHRKK